MNLIICDDDAVQVASLMDYLADRPDYKVFPFYSGQDLLDSMPPYCDIAILDVKLQDTLGIQLATALQKAYRGVDILFISSYPRYVTAAFQIDAAQFLVKPIQREYFLRIFDQVLEKRLHRNFRWVVANKNTVYSLPPAEILFVEAYHRHLFIHTRKETIEICGKLEDAQCILESYGFYPCHQGFLVNLRHIQQIGSDALLCTNGCKVPISVRKRKAFLQQFTLFLTEQK